MYFSAPNTNKALEILAAAGHGAEKHTASRPFSGWRYVVAVDAPHLPRINGKVQTVTIREPRQLLGWGATQAEVAAMERAEAAGLG
jgi:hypothetical protein